MKDGMIALDSPAGMEIGFTSDAFGGWLWRMGDTIIISFIESKARGNFRRLVERIHARGLAVQVPTPLGRMEEIVRKNGYRYEVIDDPDMGPVETWTQEARP